MEVKEDGVFIRLRKEEVVCEDKDSSKEVSSDVFDPVVEKVPEIGSEVAVPLEAIPGPTHRRIPTGNQTGSNSVLRAAIFIQLLA